MDTPLPEEVISKRKRKNIGIIVAVLLVVLLSVLGIRSSLSASLKRSAILTAVVEKGNVENTLNASGEVLPEFEETITSPINASIQKVLRNEGSPVKGGESVLTLDKSAVQAAMQKLKFQLESKQNSIGKLRLDLDKSFYDLTSSNEIKELRIKSLQATLDNSERLFKAGGGTREDVDQARQNLQVALLEKKQLENEIANKQQTMKADIKEAELAAQIEQSDLADLSRKLSQADIVASRPGVVTWINKNIGTSIREGDPLARIADLRSFKIAGSIADNYFDQLHTGMPAIVRIGETQLHGKVVNVYPAVQNNIVSFDIRLEEPAHQLLRPNMKVDVFLVTTMHSGVLRVANGPAFKGTPSQDVFVLEKGTATRRTVHTGLVNFDYVELTGNVREGEVLIITDLSALKYTSEIHIKD